MACAPVRKCACGAALAHSAGLRALSWVRGFVGFLRGLQGYEFEPCGPRGPSLFVARSLERRPETRRRRISEGMTKRASLPLDAS